MAMFIHFFCLCPLSLTIKLNFDISKVAYCLIILDPQLKNALTNVKRFIYKFEACKRML